MDSFSQKMRSITMRCSTAASRPMAAMVSWRVRSVMIMMMMMMMMMILSCSRQMNNHNNHHTMVDGFSILLLAAARRGNLKRALDIDNDDWKNAATTKMGRGQLVTGVTLPTEVRIYSCLIYIYVQVFRFRYRRCSAQTQHHASSVHRVPSKDGNSVTNFVWSVPMSMGRTMHCRGNVPAVDLICTGEI